MVKEAIDQGLKCLEGGDSAARLAELQRLFDEAVAEDSLPPKTQEVNNHVHTQYSFSPYNPSQTAYMAWQSGLQAVGIMDHDSYAGAAEMVAACKILGTASTCGVELRVSAEDSFMATQRINNPDSRGIFYMTVQGIALRHRQAVQEFLQPIREARNQRNRQQLSALNILLEEYFSDPDFQLDFQTEVYEQSRASEGGSISERHILAALARRLIQTFGKGKKLLQQLEYMFAGSISSRIAKYLTDPNNPHYLYDLLGLLKSHLLAEFFIQPGEDECIPATQAVEFANSIGAIPAYAYLGDISESSTGDKKAEKFEDSFIEPLFAQLHDWNFRALTFMPPRNSKTQLARIMALCHEHGFMQISGVDINSSRQSFRCPEILTPEFQHLNESTWALVAHEKLQDLNPNLGLFSSPSLNSRYSLRERLAAFATIGREMNYHNPDLRKPAQQLAGGSL